MKRSNLITLAGATTLRNELAHIVRILRPEVTKALGAAAEGDRSENAEYIYRKKQLREIDRRLRYLQKRCEEFQVIEHKPQDQNTGFLGRKLRLKMNPVRKSCIELLALMSLIKPAITSVLTHRWLELYSKNNWMMK